MEARVVLKGDLCVAGLPTDAIVGANYKDKRNAVFHMPHQELHNLIATNGLTTENHSVVVIPSGCMLIMAGECTMLRWSLSSDDRDAARAKDCLQHVIAEFPELKASSSGYAQYAQYLGLRV